LPAVSTLDDMMRVIWDDKPCDSGHKLEIAFCGRKHIIAQHDQITSKRELSIVSPDCTHSGFFAPLLGALEKTRDDGSYFDVQTVINYEGPNVNWNDHIDNPNLKRIINVWGTAPNEIIETRANQIPGCNTNGSVSCIDPSKKPVVISDFGPPSNPTNLLSEWSKAGFTGSAPGGIENVNILILNARHNDFSYDATAWNDPGNQFEPEMIAQEINRKTNKFMRLLYQFSLTDQTRPGDLRFFLENTTGISFDSANQVWVVDPSQLEF